MPSTIGAPATRALAGVGCTTLEQLAGVPRAELAALHGVGPKALVLLDAALGRAGSGVGLTRTDIWSVRAEFGHHRGQPADQIAGQEAERPTERQPVTGGAVHVARPAGGLRRSVPRARIPATAPARTSPLPEVPRPICPETPRQHRPSGVGDQAAGSRPPPGRVRGDLAHVVGHVVPRSRPSSRPASWRFGVRTSRPASGATTSSNPGRTPSAYASSTSQDLVRQQRDGLADQLGGVSGSSRPGPMSDHVDLAQRVLERGRDRAR